MASIWEHYCGKAVCMGVGLGRHQWCRERADSRKDYMALSMQTRGSTEPALDPLDRELGGCLLHGRGRTAVV